MASLREGLAQGRLVPSVAQSPAPSSASKPPRSASAEAPSPYAAAADAAAWVVTLESVSAIAFAAVPAAFVRRIGRCTHPAGRAVGERGLLTVSKCFILPAAIPSMEGPV
jgi:hypothetical protein